MKKLLFISAILMVICSVCLNAQNNQSKSDLYKIYALRFKSLGINSAAGSVAGASANDSIDVCYMIWFLKGDNGRNILIDAGDLDSTEVGSKNFIRPDLLLKDIGVKPSEITDIIITHPHFDHINGLKLFPSGKVWMQRNDFDYFVVDAWRDSNYREGFNKDDVSNLINVSLKGRLSLVDGDNIEIIPGIKVYTGSKHTCDNQYLIVNSASHKKILLASDAVWFYLNLQRMASTGFATMDPQSYVNAMKRMKTLVDERYIIPGHDNAVFSMFRKVTDRVVLIE